MKPYFLNFRTRDEMALWKRWVWRALGKESSGLDIEDGLTVFVVAYTYRNVTLIWDIQFKETK